MKSKSIKNYKEYYKKYIVLLYGVFCVLSFNGFAYYLPLYPQLPSYPFSHNGVCSYYGNYHSVQGSTCYTNSGACALTIPVPVLSNFTSTLSISGCINLGIFFTCANTPQTIAVYHQPVCAPMGSACSCKFYDYYYNTYTFNLGTVGL